MKEINEFVEYQGHWSGSTKKKHVTGMEFRSISEFLGYIGSHDNTGKIGHESETGSFYFTGTHSYDEAMKLLKNGWTDEAKKLTQIMDALIKTKQNVMQRRQVRSVAGGQAIVAAYLNGAPNNMMQQKLEPKKQKVITITKAIGYLADVSKETIREEAIKALKVVMKLEAQGYRVNLNVMSVSESGSDAIACKVRVKNANEKLNISKVAFPMCHPSFFRRMVFKFREVFPNNLLWKNYGATCNKKFYRAMMEDHEYLIPNFIHIDVDKTWCLEDLETC